MKRPEDTVQSEELTEEEQQMLDELLEAHNDTFRKDEVIPEARVPEIKPNGTDSEKDDKAANSEVYI